MFTDLKSTKANVKAAAMQGASRKQVELDAEIMYLALVGDGTTPDSGVLEASERARCRLLSFTPKEADVSRLDLLFTDVDFDFGPQIWGMVQRWHCAPDGV